MQGGNEPEPALSSEAEVTWEASEYIHHQKNSSWYLGFVGVVILAATLLYVLLRDVFSVIVLFLMAVAVGIYAGRKPQVQRYALSHNGLSIGNRHYEFDEFKSFSLSEEGSVLSVTFTPLKRFMPPISIYFMPQDADRISGVLEGSLPHEEHQPDVVDRLMKKIRF